MTETIEIWFPNYKNNPGIVSKELLKMIQNKIQHFEAEVQEGYFKGYETFVLDISFEDNSYREYVIELILKKFGGFPDPVELEKGDHLLGRVFSPGKVGFGIFVDIGLRHVREQNDALLPLYQLRDDLKLEDHSTRDIVKSLGLVSGYPVPVVINDIEFDPKLKIDVRLDPEYIDQIMDWTEQGNDRIIVTKTLRSNITSLLDKLDLDKYVNQVQSLDPLTTVISCDARTNASGWIPKLGSRLKNAPIGIFRSFSN